MKEDISERIFSEGIEEGEALLEKAVRMLKEGEKEAEILAAGITEPILNKAKTIISLRGGIFPAFMRKNVPATIIIQDRHQLESMYPYNSLELIGNYDSNNS